MLADSLLLLHFRYVSLTPELEGLQCPASGELPETQQPIAAQPGAFREASCEHQGSLDVRAASASAFAAQPVCINAACCRARQQNDLDWLDRALKKRRPIDDKANDVQK